MRDRLVLGYHGISASDAAERTVPQSALRAHVEALVGRGYANATFSDLVEATTGGRWFAVTFDDGERSVRDYAFPALSELGVRGTLFVPVAFVGTPGKLGWDDVAALADAGWEVGSHTITHPHLTALDDAALDEELRGSREAIEDVLGRPCRSIAYPFGECDARVRAAAAAAGYSAGCTTGGPQQDDVLCWTRVGVGGADGRVFFRLKSSRVGRTLRATPLRVPLESAGRAARGLKPS